MEKNSRIKRNSKEIEILKKITRPSCFGDLYIITGKEIMKRECLNCFHLSDCIAEYNCQIKERLIRQRHPVIK